VDNVLRVLSDLEAGKTSTKVLVTA
jgi:hypothetical protein